MSTGRLRRVPVVAVLLLLSVAAARASTGTPIRVTRGKQLSAAPWVELAHAKSRRSKLVASARGFRWTPTALAFTVEAIPVQRVTVVWSVYCEGSANDEIFTPQGTFKFQAPFVAYPPVLANATKCFLTVRATPTRSGRASVAVFGY